MRKGQVSHIICFIFAFLLLFMNIQVFAGTVVHVSKVSINKTTDTLIAGRTDILKVTLTPTNATNKTVKWTSSNTTVVKIDIYGKVTALKAGTATITGTTVDKGLKIYCKITVKPIPVVHVSKVSINKTTDTLIVGGTDNLKTTITPTNATNKTVKWTSSNTTVIKIDIYGKVTALKAGTATITVKTADGGKIVTCRVTVNNKKGYVYNPELQIDLNVRSAPNLKSSVIGYLYNYNKIEILDTIIDTKDNVVWDKIAYNNSVGFAYVSNTYIQPYISPPDNVVNIAVNITKQFEAATPNQIAGNIDGQGLSLGYLQWCIGQGRLQPILNRMDREYKSETKSIFGTNYNAMHTMLLGTSVKQIIWAKSINSSSNNIIEPWRSELVSLCNNPDFKSIEADAQIYIVKQAMLICDKYNLKTVRGFALAFDIDTIDGSISLEDTKTINAALAKNPNMTEKNLLGIIANTVGRSSSDIVSREKNIVNGKGTVHGSILNLDTKYGLSDALFR